MVQSSALGTKTIPLLYRFNGLTSRTTRTQHGGIVVSTYLTKQNKQTWKHKLDRRRGLGSRKRLWSTPRLA
jgi:hypothetical protein